MFLPYGDEPNPEGFIPWVTWLLIAANCAIFFGHHTRNRCSFGLERGGRRRLLRVQLPQRASRANKPPMI